MPHLRRGALTAVALGALAAPGCSGTSQPAASRDSGVSGITVVDQGCTVIRGSTPCPTEPLPAKILAVPAGSEETAGEATSGSDGRFRIRLQPGHYVLRPQNLTGAPVPTARPVPVDVPSGGYVEVTVQFDSGIRRTS